MIAHIILFEPRPDLPELARRDLVDGMRAAARDIPAVRRFRLGQRILHGRPGYEQLMGETYSFAAVIEFDTADDLRAYLAHPAHERIGRHFYASSLRALAFDYELTDAADSALLK